MQHGLCFAQLNSEVRLIASQKVPCGNELVKKKLRSPSHLDSDIKVMMYAYVLIAEQIPFTTLILMGLEPKYHPWR